MTRESDVSVLIPSYRRPQMTRRAIESALATGAGEVIVSDDVSGDGTVEEISKVRDPRLRIVVQPKNLGLWRNHLALLKMAARPWVKFLQNDDRIAPGGLAAMVAAVGPETTVVSTLQTIEDVDTHQRQTTFRISAPTRWSSDQYMRRLLVVGNELGSPSETLYRADVLDRDEEAWRNDTSADLISNVLAASRGEVVLMPAGLTITTEHPGRDTNSGSIELWYRRLLNSVNYLMEVPDERVRRFARIFSTVESLGSLRMALGIKRRGGKLHERFFGDFMDTLGQGVSGRILRDLPDIIDMMRWKYIGREGRQVDAQKMG